MNEPRAYYNENDSAAADILRHLIAYNVIAPGDVDTRSIKDVTAIDLRGYTQCHFFAGGGLWSVAARMAGWSDERPLWTGSCPCQPFSAAGKGAGADDPRHLWPDLFRLVRDASQAGYGPPVLMGEQVSGAAGENWFDGVSADLASQGFSSRSRDIPACAVDAPHQRNRLYWIAVGDGGREHWRTGPVDAKDRQISANTNGASLLLDTQGVGRREGRAEHELRRRRRPTSHTDVFLQPDTKNLQSKHHGYGNGAGEPRLTDANGSVLANADQLEFQGQPPTRQQSFAQLDASPLRSYWADAEWIVSPLDGKARRAKPGLPFLVDGIPGRVDLWRVCGNAISPVLAAEVITAFLETET